MLDLVVHAPTGAMLHQFWEMVLRTSASTALSTSNSRCGPGADSLVNYQATAPCRSVKVPVGPSAPMVAMATMASVPSVTV